MMLVIVGAVFMLASALLFWWCLPRGDKPHFFIETVWEPYFGVAVISGLIMGFTLLVSGVVNVAS